MINNEDGNFKGSANIEFFARESLVQALHLHASVSHYLFKFFKRKRKKELLKEECIFLSRLFVTSIKNFCVNVIGHEIRGNRK